MHKIRALVAALTAAAGSPALFGSVIYVNATATGANSGASWDDAYTSLQNALSAATAGDEIWIARGTYTPDPANRAVSFALKDNVSMFGGFAGTETSVAGRAPDPSPAVADPLTDTILSGEIGAPGTADNSLSVVTGTNISSTTVIDGLTVTRGFNESTSGRGAGINLSGSSAVISRCAVIQNSAANGAGMNASGPGNPTISGCHFEGNSSMTRAGAINAVGTPALTITDSSFINNTATIAAGAIDLTNAGGSITGCRFSGNRAATQGGAVRLNSSSPSIAGCTFAGNSTDFDTVTSAGGALWASRSTSTVDRCTFRNNSSREGGALCTSQGSFLTVTNCLFHDNHAFTGGAVMSGLAATRFLNCTIVRNSDDNHSAGGIFAPSPGGAEITNCIIRGNVGLQVDGSGLIISCNIEQSVGGFYNTNLDPLFVSPATNNFRLQPPSPSIDAGNGGVLDPALVTDLDGLPRHADVSSVPNTGRGFPRYIDLGAYETPAPPCLVDVNADGTINTSDLTLLLVRFGQTVPPGSQGDVNSDGTVNTTDLGLLLIGFGAECP